MTANEQWMPDDLIKQKSWQALSEAEKEWVQDVAGSEEEYNLLRQMLLNAAAEPAAATGPGPEVAERLQAVFVNEKKRKGRVVIWRYAAAAAVLVAIAGYVFLQRAQDKNDRLAGNTQSTQDAITKNSERDIPTAQTQPATTPVPGQESVADNKQDQVAAKTDSAVAPVPGTLTTDAMTDNKKSISLNEDVNLPVSPPASTGSRVKDHEELAGLVTAVY